MVEICVRIVNILAKVVEDEASRQKKKKKTKENIHGCSERGHEVCLCDRRDRGRWRQATSCGNP